MDAVNLFRQVIEECHECLGFHKDPSVLFVPVPIPHMKFTPPDERIPRDFGTEGTSKESRASSVGLDR